MHDSRARGDMEVFFLEQWLEDRDKSRLEYDSEIWNLNLAKGLTIFARMDLRVSL
jgi:hypothetical protein